MTYVSVVKVSDLEYVTKVFSRHMKVDAAQYKISDTARFHGGKKNATIPWTAEGEI